MRRLGVNRGTIIVRRALEEAKLGRGCRVARVEHFGDVFGATGVGVGAWGGGDVWGVHSCVAETTGSVLDWPEDEVISLGRARRLAAAENKADQRGDR